MLPLLLASLGFVTAAVVNLNALALSRDRDPQMPKIHLDFLRHDIWGKRLASYIDCWCLLPNPQGIFLVSVVAIVCFVANPFWLFDSLDGRGMTIIFGLNVVFGLWTIAWLWCRFLVVWSLLRSVLETLEDSPLRFALSMLRKVFSLEPIWSYAGLRRNVILPMRWFEYFRVTPRLPNAAMRNAVSLIRLLSACSTIRC